MLPMTRGLTLVDPKKQHPQQVNMIYMVSAIAVPSFNPMINSFLPNTIYHKLITQKTKGVKTSRTLTDILYSLVIEMPNCLFSYKISLTLNVLN